MNELIEKLEKLSGPCRETDGKIKLAHAAWLIAEGKKTPEVTEATNGDLYDEPRPYTGSLDAVRFLKPPGCTYAVGDCNEDDQPWACVTDADGNDYAATGATEIIALCIASLEAHASLRARAQG